MRQAKRLCAPVNKNGEDPTAPNHPGHETAYTIRQTSPKFDRKKDIPVTVANDFGSQPPSFPTFTVDLVRAERLLVPTSKSLVGPNFPPPLTGELDHFKCYRVRGARFRRASVSVETQFGNRNVAIKRPREICVPVDKNGEGIFDDTRGLMCFQVRTTPQTPRQVFTTNQFEQGAYDIFGVRELCVPAFVNPGTCGDGTINAPGEACDPTGPNTECPSGVCASDCTCAPPTCGDGVVNQDAEECDGGDAPACPGVCQQDCTCPEPITCGAGGASTAGCRCADGFVTQSFCFENESCAQRRAIMVTICEDVHGGVDEDCTSTACFDCATNQLCEDSRCGDGVVNQSTEQCDGGAGDCPQGCQQDCTCPPPTCSDLLGPCTQHSDCCQPYVCAPGVNICFPPI